MDEFDKAQKMIYGKMSKNEWEQNKGRFAVVEIDKNDFFISDDPTQASIKARAKYPHSLFTIIKIGYNAAETIGGSLEPLSF